MTQYEVAAESKEWSCKVHSRYLSWVLSVFHQIIKYFTDTDHQDRGHLGIGPLSYLYISLVYFRHFSMPPHGEIQQSSVFAITLVLIMITWIIVYKLVAKVNCNMFQSQPFRMWRSHAAATKNNDVETTHAFVKLKQIKAAVSDGGIKFQ